LAIAAVVQAGDVAKKDCMTSLFEPRAVGFLDILGFQELIDKAEASQNGFQRLAGLRAVIDNHVLLDNDGLAVSVPKKVKPLYISVSDSVILSAPLRHEHKNLADGLAIVVIKMIQIAQKVIELGHLVRGGISVGNVWHDERNIFGSGYIDAYKTERGAEHPRVLLSRKAQDVWNEPGRTDGNLCIKSGDNLIVDVLHTGYLRGTAEGLVYEEYFKMLRVHIETNLYNMQLGSPEWTKWEWMAGFFNDAIVRHQINVRQFDALPIPDRA
jgi:hypothetical protein